MLVRFMINETRGVVEKFIPSYYLAENFVRKLRHSKKCTLLSYSKPY